MKTVHGIFYHNCMSMHETVHVICCLQDKPVKCIMTVVVRARSTIDIHLCINYSASKNPERRSVWRHSQRSFNANDRIRSYRHY